MKKMSMYGSAAISALALATSAGMATPFGAGTLIVVRFGDGTTALSSNATATFIEERSPVDGSLIQVVGLPTAAAGSNVICTNSGTATSEGFLSLAPNNTYLVCGGYNAATGTASVTTSATISRVVARINVNGTVDTSTQLLASGGDGNTGNIRSVTTNDGTAFWAGTSAGGTRYQTFGTNAASTQVCGTPANQRVLNVVSGQLYGSANSGTFTNVFTIGTGLPTTSGQTATSLAGMPTASASNYDYFFADANTLYVADDGTAATTGGVQKWMLSGGTWSNPYKYVLGASGVCRGLTGKVSGGVATLYTTSTASAIWTISDTVASSTAGPAATQLANGTAPTNTAFRGIRVLPGTFGGVIDGKCCFDDGTCSVTTSAGCATLGGTYGGNFTTCTPNTCPQPGRCCLTDNTCLVLSAGQCAAISGAVFGGAGTACISCGNRTGACCTSGVCTVVTQSACTGGGGVYRGDGTSCATANCGSFNAASLVLLEVTSTTPNTASSMLLREVNAVSGATVQAVGLPAARTEFGNRAATLNGASTTEGELQRSTDGHYLVLMGYNLSDATNGPAGSTTSRVVARVDSSCRVDTTTAFTDHTFEGSSPRGAASVDGSAFWLVGDAVDLPNRGVRYALLGANTSLQLNTDTTNNRDVGIFNGNLYFSSGSTPTGTNQLGTGIPTTAGQTTANLTGNANPQGFWFADATTLYVGSNAGAGAGAPGVIKYTFDGTSWLLAYAIPGGLSVPIQQLTGVSNRAGVTLYGTTGEGLNGAATPANKLYSLVDTGAASAFNLITTAGASAVWKGVAFAPTPAAAVCYPNCDASTQPPVLNVADFTCFLQKYAAGDPYANCDNSTQPPVLNVADFTCFLQKYAAGCT